MVGSQLSCVSQVWQAVRGQLPYVFHRCGKRSAVSCPMCFTGVVSGRQSVVLCFTGVASGRQSVALCVSQVW